MNNDFLSRVRRFDNDFHEWRSHSWKSLPNCESSLVKIIAESPHEWKKIVIYGNECIILFFLHAILCYEHTNPLKTIIERSFRHCCQGWHFMTQHCDVTTIDLWCHANARNWYCDVIFVDCNCTRKLAQRRSSLVYNNREYRYPPGIHGLACKKYCITTPSCITWCHELCPRRFIIAKCCHLLMYATASSFAAACPMA